MTWLRVLAATLLVQGAAHDARPLPDADAMFAAVRRNLERSEEAQRGFAYTERRSDVRFNPFGRLGTTGSRVVEVVPNENGTVTRRLIERDGTPLNGPPVERNRRRSPRARAMVDDVVATLDVRLDRRGLLDGRPALIAVFKGKPESKPRSREGRLARSFQGTIWIDEQAQEVARVEAVALDDITFGYGLLARMKKGSTVVAIRQPIDSEIWLPVSVRFSGEGRALLFRKLTIDFAIDWFNYRRVYSSSP